MVYKSFDELEAAVMQKAHKCKVAVVEAADEHVLEAVRHAVEGALWSRCCLASGKISQPNSRP